MKLLDKHVEQALKDKDVRKQFLYFLSAPKVEKTFNVSFAKEGKPQAKVPAETRP